MLQPLLVTMGDPGGIGPEIIVKSLRSFRSLERTPVVILGERRAFERVSRRGKDFWAWTQVKEVPKKSSSSILFLDVAERARQILNKKNKKTSNVSFSPGRVTAENAALAWAALERAVDSILDGRGAGLVTAPVHKTGMRLLEPSFQGHTEYLAERSRTPRYAMMFVSSRLRITLVTIHVALKKVSRLINEKSILQKIVLTHEFLRTKGSIPKPRIAVSALNPHGKETGSEEEEVISPAIRRARRMGICAEGPLPGDQIFHEAYHGKYHAVVSMYHDQALAPFKMISFYDGVNTTLGLPFVRTSPDHGTAHDIAYQDKAQCESMRQSLLRAWEWTGCKL